MLREVALLLALSAGWAGRHSERSARLVPGHSERSAKRGVEESAPPTQSIEVAGLDYAFRVPEHVRAGRTTFTFANRGKVSHEFNLNLLARDATPEQLMAALRDGKSVKTLLESSVGVLFADTGKRSVAGLTVNLLPGRTYVAICIFRDTTTAPRHHQLGMFSIIRPEGDAPPIAAIRADTIVARDYAFEYPRTLAAGHHTFVFVNRGTQRHELNMAQFAPGVTISKLREVEKAKGNVDALFGPGIGVLHSYGGNSPAGVLDVDLEAGREYMLECDFQDSDSAPSHYKLGMFGSIRVLPRQAKK